VTCFRDRSTAGALLPDASTLAAAINTCGKSSSIGAIPFPQSRLWLVASAYPHWLESLKGDFGARESTSRCSNRKTLGTATAWRQGQSYSQDLRGGFWRVDGGMAARRAAKLFQVSVSYIYKH